MDYVQLWASRARHGLGLWAWHESGGDIAVGRVTWLVHGDEGCVGLGLLAEIFFPWSGWEGWLVASAEGREDVGLGRVTWSFFTY